MKHSKLKKIVLIGASTGGPGQIQKIVNSLPKLQDVSIIIAQHMVNGFMDSFAHRLQSHHHNYVNTIRDNEILQVSNIYIIDGETKLHYVNKQLVFMKRPTPANSYNPSIDILFNSCVSLCKDIKILSVILTGIGDDGVQACKNLSENGARCMTESQKSAIIDGMPQRAREEVPNIEIYEMSEIVTMISEFCK